MHKPALCDEKRGNNFFKVKEIIFESKMIIKEFYPNRKVFLVAFTPFQSGFRFVFDY